MTAHTSYGELIATPESKILIAAAMAMATSAAAKGKIPATMDSMEWERISSRVGSKRIGIATHHEIYDVTPDAKKALICVRDVEGTKYGQKTTSKNYFLVCRHGKGLRVTVANKAKAAKVSKASESMGSAIAAL